MEGVATQILCQQCSAPLAVEPGADLVSCQFCGTTNHVDKSRTVLHYTVRPTVRPDTAKAALRRWMAGNQTVKGLEGQARIGNPVYQLFPMWLVRARHAGIESTFLLPAAATTISELTQLTIPAADLEPYQGETGDVTVEATVPYGVMMEWLARDQGVAQPDVTETALVHVPIYSIAYHYDGTHYLAVVDAATSKVFANQYPEKQVLPYRLIATVAFVANFAIALLPLGGLIIDGMDGFVRALTFYFIALPAAALLVFILAAIVAARA